MITHPIFYVEIMQPPTLHPNCGVCFIHPRSRGDNTEHKYIVVDYLHIGFFLVLRELYNLGLYFSFVRRNHFCHFTKGFDVAVISWAMQARCLSLELCDSVITALIVCCLLFGASLANIMSHIKFANSLYLLLPILYRHICFLDARLSLVRKNTYMWCGSLFVTLQRYKGYKQSQHSWKKYELNNYGFDWLWFWFVYCYMEDIFYTSGSLFVVAISIWYCMCTNNEIC